MRKLERKWSRELVVIGVHSPKFLHEQDTSAVRQAVLRHGVGHPVVNDRDFRVFKSYAARAWPTLVLIDPRGKVIGHHAGEFPLEGFDRLIGELVARLDAVGALDRRALDLTPERLATTSPLRFPGKLAADPPGRRLAIADTGHHRIVLTDLDGNVLGVVGRGTPGLVDGDADVAAFDQPQGLVLDGERLYVADTENHAIRVIEVGAERRGLASAIVRTTAGTGEQLMGERVGGPARSTRLSSPWDLTILDGTLHVAMAGTHQIWSMPLRGEALARTDLVIAPHTGNGAEALVDGPRERASMNQPSGLAHDGRVLYVADSEASAIRAIDPGAGGTIRTIVGEGLFEFGDRDGVGPAQVRLQHPLAVAWHDGVLYVADTYNHRIKRLDPRTRECRTWLGDGRPGLVDGPAATARFSEPSGLAVVDGHVFVADTSNHAIRVADLTTGEVRTLAIRGLARPPDE